MIRKWPTFWPSKLYNSDKLEMVQGKADRFVKGSYGMYESVIQMHKVINDAKCRHIGVSP